MSDYTAVGLILGVVTMGAKVEGALVAALVGASVGGSVGVTSIGPIVEGLLKISVEESVGTLGAVPVGTPAGISCETCVDVTLH
jgi:hypothetical protein